MEFNKEKFKNVLHYLISKCENKDNLGRGVLYKLVYFSDFNFYELYEEPLTGECYIHKARGPIPTHFFEARDELIHESKIKEEEKKVIDYYKYNYSSLKTVDLSLFTDNELEVLDATIDKIGNMAFNQISEYSHGDIPWRLTEEGEELNYEAVFYRSLKYSVREYDD